MDTRRDCETTWVSLILFLFSFVSLFLFAGRCLPFTFELGHVHQATESKLISIYKSQVAAWNSIKHIDIRSIKLTLGSVLSSISTIAASRYSLNAAAFLLICSASAFALASMAKACASPLRRMASASASASKTTRWRWASASFSNLNEQHQTRTARAQIRSSVKLFSWSYLLEFLGFGRSTDFGVKLLLFPQNLLFLDQNLLGAFHHLNLHLFLTKSLFGFGCLQFIRQFSFGFLSTNPTGKEWDRIKGLVFSSCKKKVRLKNRKYASICGRAYQMISNNLSRPDLGSSFYHFRHDSTTKHSSQRQEITRRK